MNGHVALIGFGEAGQAFASGWKKANANIEISAFDLKTDSGNAAVIAGKLQEYLSAKIRGLDSCGDAIAGVPSIFSLVTAEQALLAAGVAKDTIANSAFYFDCNSCAPETKKQASLLISNAGGRYVDVAVMGPVGPDLGKIPLLVSGEHAKEALPVLQQLGMNVELLPGTVGRASSVKMIRSIMVKGLEALALECILSARSAGVEEEVLNSLERTYPGFGWNMRSAHMLERAMTHGIRRAEEMREVAKTVEQFGLPNQMARAIVDWQQNVGAMGLVAQGECYQDFADQLLEKMQGNKQEN